MRIQRVLATFATVVLSSIIACGGVCSAAGDPPSPFAATALLSRPGESAEEILIRAHGNDANAIMAATAGYHLGIDGFPYDSRLGAIWGGRLLHLVPHEALALPLLGMVQQKNFADADIGLGLAACHNAKKSAYIPLLEKNGIFTAVQFCAQLEERKKSLSSWEKPYRAIIAKGADAVQKIHEGMTAVRAFRDVPLAPKTLENFLAAYDLLPTEFVVFYAATTHAPANDAPDWSDERLLAFIAACLKAAETKSSAQAALHSASEYAKNILVSRLIMEDGLPLQTIQAAHAMRSGSLSGKDAQILRSIAAHYRKGDAGFPKDAFLARCWLQRAALMGDAPSAAALSTEALFEEKYPEAWAWAWASSAGRQNSPGTPEVAPALALQLRATIEAHAGKNVSEQGKAVAAWLTEERETILATP